MTEYEEYMATVCLNVVHNGFMAQNVEDASNQTSNVVGKSVDTTEEIQKLFNTLVTELRDLQEYKNYLRMSKDNAHGQTNHFQTHVLLFTQILIRKVVIDQFPSKSVKVFRKIGWVSIPSKSFKVL